MVLRLTMAMLAMMLVAACGTNGSPQPASVELDGDAVSIDAGIAENALDPATGPPFPAADGLTTRSISDDSVKVLGREWHSKSENAEEVGSTLELNGEGSTWGIYALGGFGLVTPGSVYASFFTDDEMPCRIFLGVANFETGKWDFVDAGKDDFGYQFAPGGRYHSDTGVCYVSVLRSGEGDAKLYSLEFGRLGETDLESPAGLTVAADPGLVSLDWLPVDNAVGYNVYRAYDKKFTDQIKLNEDPISTDEYADSWLVNGEMYFYRVTAVAAIESAYSAYVSVYVPAADLPAPQNLRAEEVGDFHFTIAWDWEGPSPSNGWVVYMANAADFNLELPTIKKNIPQGGARQYTFSNLDPGRLYFVRMAAKSDSGGLGRMTDALPCLTGDQWEWFDVEEIDLGTEPVSAVIADGQICAAYFKDRVVHVARNNGLGEPWVVENTDLDWDIMFYNKRIEDYVTAGGFARYLDVDYRDGTYLICSVTYDSKDFYAAIGAPEVGWDVELIDEGTGGFLDAPSAGLYTSVAISDNGYNAAGIDFYGGGLKYYSRQFGDDKPWVKSQLYTVSEYWPTEIDMEVRDGRLFASIFDYEQRQLFLWDQDADDFIQVTNNPAGWTFGLAYTDLELVQDNWTLAGYDGAEKDVLLLQDQGGSFWEEEIVTESEDGRTGKGCRIEPFRDGLISVYQGGGIKDWYCSVLRGNGEWETQLMKIGEIDAYERADLKILNDRPVVIVADRITKKVYAIRGNIPLE